MAKLVLEVQDRHTEIHDNFILQEENEDTPKVFYMYSELWLEIKKKQLSFSYKVIL